jgi:hypothetical protein
VGNGHDVETFIAESHFAATVADWKCQGEAALASMIEGVYPDVVELRTGRQSLACATRRNSGD